MFKIFKKPLIRWTIGGNISQFGIDCLGQSINSWKNLYGNSFDYFICYNNIDKNKLNFNVNLINQNEHLNSLSILPNLTAWKLYPPRISLQSHEIFIDNDLIVYKKIPLIDNFLKNKNIFFCTEAIKRCFGNYSNENHKEIKLNSGLFGIPPYFDFEKNIESKIKHRWRDWFDEQGLVTSILYENEVKIISLNDIWICLNNFYLGEYGVHFVGLNSGFDIFWKEYLKTIK